METKLTQVDNLGAKLVIFPISYLSKPQINSKLKYNTKNQGTITSRTCSTFIFLICNTTSSKRTSSSFSLPASSVPPKIGGLSISCARVGGVEIPNSKRVEFSLQYIHGIGRTTAKQILVDLGMDNKFTKDLSEKELTSLREEVTQYMIEGDLLLFELELRSTALAIRRLKEIQCYRGVRRHIQGLPCGGQRTKNNCRTLKGKKVTVAGKKKAPR
ncbi:unnamed protein product [Coffea canephora]|uniref:30S ribosomal protein S13, chloroplastic n=1 Tax=Coffea canephora TaxID=49390 RepID=A0A068V9F4_COFCA|nr:unnamed protein product [Coffea canephora]